jgi:hypothetical protein
MVRMVSDAGRGFLRALIVYSIKHIDRRTWKVTLKMKYVVMASEIEIRRRRSPSRRRVLSASTISTSFYNPLPQSQVR